MRKAYYVYVLVLSLIPVNLNATLWFMIPPVQINIGDLFNAFIMFAAVWVIRRRGLRNINSTVEVVYLLFLGWLLVACLRGMFQFGYRAIGEFRTILYAFSFFLPYMVLEKLENDQERSKELFALVENTILISAIAASVMQFVGTHLGFSISDYRGERVLNSDQSFLVLLGACYVGVKYVVRGNVRMWEVLLAIMFLGVGIVSKNRIALVALSTVFAAFLLIRRKFSLFAMAALLTISIVALTVYLSPSKAEEYEAAYGVLIDPVSDQDLNWRILVQGAAIEQAFDTFWFGQGYGGYYELLVPGLNYNIPYNITPHSQFLNLFLKTGIVGLVLCLVTMLAPVLAYRRVKRIRELGADSRVIISVVLLVVCSQFIYGLGYDFIPLFGVFFAFGALCIVGSKQPFQGSTTQIVA
jgi:O-antigen ligase